MAGISTDELLNRIMEMESADKRDNLRWLDSRSYVLTTKETAALLTKKKTIAGESVVIKRNLKRDLVLWIVFGFLTVVPIGYITIRELLNANRNPIGIIIGISLLFLFAFVTYKNLTLKELTMPVLLTAKQINVTGETLQWEEMENTFMAFRPMGRTTKVFCHWTQNRRSKVF
jgi:hypothetical protein